MRTWSTAFVRAAVALVASGRLLRWLGRFRIRSLTGVAPCGSRFVSARSRKTGRPELLEMTGCIPGGLPLGETGKAEGGHPRRGPKVSRRDKGRPGRTSREEAACRKGIRGAIGQEGNSASRGREAWRPTRRKGLVVSRFRGSCPLRSEGRSACEGVDIHRGQRRDVDQVEGFCTAFLQVAGQGRSGLVPAADELLYGAFAEI
jgi:hypothetical protein